MNEKALKKDYIINLKMTGLVVLLLLVACAIGYFVADYIMFHQFEVVFALIVLSFLPKFIRILNKRVSIPPSWW